MKALVKKLMGVKGRRVAVLVGSSFLLVILLSLHTFSGGLTWRGLTPIFGQYTFIILLVGMGTALWLMGVREQEKHIDNLKHVPIRIHVNGIRGKSTVTRIIGGALREGGLRTLTKTTGKAACLIDEKGVERPIIRQGRANIREQVDIMNLAMEKRMDALVIECMALHPELQKVSEHKMIQATIGVITNVRADHLDVMGPTLKDVAMNLSSTVPKDAILVTAEREHLKILEEKATEIRAQVFPVDPDSIDDEVLKKFSYLNFKENVAIALEVARLIGIPDDVALRGMYKAQPDPGLMTINRTRVDGEVFTFINAFGVNDKDSTTVVYNELERRGYFSDAHLVGVFHARGDRVTRTLDFGKAMVEEMGFERIVLIGKMTNLFIIEAMKAGYLKDRIIDLGDVSGDRAIEEMSRIAKEHRSTGNDTVFFGCGNMVGDIPTRILTKVKEGETGPSDTGMDETSKEGD
jgi:poly-gamma-glutamate synthase PgsB/CapB